MVLFYLCKDTKNISQNYKNVHILDFLASFLAYFYDISFLFGKNVVILHPILYTISNNESI
jgi:hypothetical protein